MARNTPHPASDRRTAAAACRLNGVMSSICSMKNHGRRASDDGKFGIPRRATASRPDPKRTYKPRRGLNYISGWSKSAHVCESQTR
jgi:hypothetical protein